MSVMVMAAHSPASIINKFGLTPLGAYQPSSQKISPERLLSRRGDDLFQSEVPDSQPAQAIVRRGICPAPESCFQSGLRFLQRNFFPAGRLFTADGDSQIFIFGGQIRGIPGYGNSLHIVCGKPVQHPAHFDCYFPEQFLRKEKGRGADFVEIEPAVHQNNGKNVTGNRPEFSFKTAPGRSQCFAPSPVKSCGVFIQKVEIIRCLVRDLAVEQGHGERFFFLLRAAAETAVGAVLVDQNAVRKGDRTGRREPFFPKRFVIGEIVIHIMLPGEDVRLAGAVVLLYSEGSVSANVRTDGRKPDFMRFRKNKKKTCIERNLSVQAFSTKPKWWNW